MLNPIERTSEVIFGLLMAMTFIGTLNAVSEEESVHTLLIAAVGCNVAWGLVDAVMHLITSATEKRRHAILLQQLRGGADPAIARHLISDLLPNSVATSLGAEGLEEVRRHLLKAAEPHARPRLERDDYRAALGIFLLVVLATLPVALPFMLVQDVVLAVRLSQAVALGMLFLGGAALARYSGEPVWRTGTLMAAMGGALVAIIVVLGG